MGFANVFGNIDYGMLPRAQIAQQNQLMQAIGQGIGTYERRQDREMKRKQMEQKAQELDLSQAAQEALYKMAQNIPLTPQEEAAIQAYSTFKPPQTFIDPLTQNQVTRPSLAESAGLPPFAQALGIPPAQQGGLTPPSFASIPPVSEGELFGPSLPAPGRPEPMPPSGFVAPERLGVRGEIMEAEFGRDVAKERATGEIGAEIGLDVYQGKKEIDDVFEGQKLNKASLAKQKNL